MRFGEDVTITNGQHGDHHAPHVISDVVHGWVDVSFEEAQLIGHTHKCNKHRVTQHKPRLLLHYCLHGKTVICLCSVNSTDPLSSWVSIETHIYSSLGDIQQTEKDHKTEQEIIPLESYSCREIICIFIINHIMEKGVWHYKHENYFNAPYFEISSVKDIIKLCIDLLKLLPSYC